MNIIIKTHDVELTDAIKQYTEQKFNNLSNRLGTDAILEVELGRTEKHHKDGDHYIVKAHAKYGTRSVHVESVKSDLYAAIDNSKDKLEDEIAHAGDKSRSITRNLARRIKSIFKGHN